MPRENPVGGRALGRQEEQRRKEEAERVAKAKAEAEAKKVESVSKRGGK